jgi:hypothetical protein
MTDSLQLEPRTGSPAGGRQLVIRAAGIHLATRILTLAAFAFGARHQHRAFARVVTMWDGGFYASITAHGYPHRLPTGPNGVRASTAAFFPLFPLLNRPFTALGIPFWLSSLVLVAALSTVAAALIALVVRRYASDRVALLTASCWSAYPLAGVLSAAYSEALLTMLAAGCLLALLDRRWLTAGLLALLAGATRPTGAVLALACLVAASLAIKQRREWSSLLAVILAPIGVLASWAWIGWQAGRWDAWFATEQGGWHAHFDGGVDTVRSVVHELSGSATQAFAPVQAAFVLAAVGLVVIAAWQRPPAPVLTYLIAGFVLAVGTSNVHASIARFLLPIFPILVPIAMLLDRLGRRIAVPVLILTACGSALIGAWYFTAGSFAP